MIDIQQRMRLLRHISDEKLTEIETLFELAKSKSDFCLQCGCNPIVFGGWNRVYYYPTGFEGNNGEIKVSISHCNNFMINAAKTLGYQLI